MPAALGFGLSWMFRRDAFPDAPEGTGYTASNYVETDYWTPE